MVAAYNNEYASAHRASGGLYRSHNNTSYSHHQQQGTYKTERHPSALHKSPNGRDSAMMLDEVSNATGFEASILPINPEPEFASMFATQFLPEYFKNADHIE